MSKPCAAIFLLSSLFLIHLCSDGTYECHEGEVHEGKRCYDRDSRLLSVAEFIGLKYKDVKAVVEGLKSIAAGELNTNCFFKFGFF